MEQPQTEVQEQPLGLPSSQAEPRVVVAPSAPLDGVISPQACSSCGATPAAGGATATPALSSRCIYVIGHIEPRFPLLSLEKEARQITARGSASKDTDREVMAKLLRDPHNKYVVRQLCWVLSVLGVETYILMPRDGDYQPLVDAYRAEANPGDLELVIGIRGPIAPPTICNGLQVPVVVIDQIYPFDRKSLLESLPKKEGDSNKFSAAAGEMFDRIMQQSDNAGATDCDRALNYLAVRYDRIYSLAAEQFVNNHSFTSIDCRVSPLSGARKIVDVAFCFTDRTTDVVSKYFTRVDVTECFPFLVTPLQQYFDNNR